MGFEDIVGQQRAISDLQHAFARGRIPNAYLFAGPKGVGKASTAMILARLVNCEAVRSDHQPCDICSSCRKIIQGNHLDIWTVEATKSILRIKQIRELQSKLRHPPGEGKVRVVVLDGAEKMNQEAANAFLKTLEEPPPGNLFVLLSSQPSMLLPTILSRCQRVPFAPLRREVLAALLVSKFGFDPLRADLAAGIAEGSVGRSLLLEQMLEGEERREFLLALPSLHQYPEGVSVAMSLAEKLAKQPEQLQNYLLLMKIWFRDVLFFREVPEPESYVINKDLVLSIQTHAALLTTEQLADLIRAIEQALYHMTRNVSAQLALEQLFLSCHRATAASVAIS